MGGALITQFMERSRLSHDVAASSSTLRCSTGRSLIEFNAEQIGLPGFLGMPVEWAIDARVESRLGQPRRPRAPRGLPPADPALPRHRGRAGPDRDQRRLRRRAAALGHLLPRARWPATRKAGTSIHASTTAGCSAFSCKRHFPRRRIGPGARTGQKRFEPDLAIGLE